MVLMNESAPPDIGPQPPRVSGPTVYHYTNAAGLIGIVESKCLWASSPLALNDLSEYTYGLEIAQEIWADLPKEGLSFLQVDFMEQVLDPAEDMLGKTFVLSASYDPDSLNQWQGYAGRQGYCVGIDTARPLAVLDSYDSLEHGYEFYSRRTAAGWHEVVYDVDEQRRQITQLLQFILEDSFIGHVRRHGTVETYAMRAYADLLLETLIAHLKHSAFANEREVRYVASTALGFRPEFRAGPYGVTPYVKLTASDDRGTGYIKEPERPLPLTEVVCGPLNASERTPVLDAGRRLAACHGYVIPVRSSQAPYRF